MMRFNCDLFIGCRSYFFKTTWLTRTSSMQQTPGLVMNGVRSHAHALAHAITKNGLVCDLSHS